MSPAVPAGRSAERRRVCPMASCAGVVTGGREALGSLGSAAISDLA
jgi:hypothetical protein